jgi:hypothetical protein
MSLDWPNLIAGAAIGIIITLLRVFLLRLWHSIIDKKPSYDIVGDWYSAEYDIKSVDRNRRNTILKVKVRKSLGGRVTVRPTDVIQFANPKLETQWKVTGEICNDVLAGKWSSTVKHTNRHGTVLLKFCDNGRAIGYYLGTADVPVCGYWLLSRDETDIRELSDAVIEHYKWNDLKTIVDKHDPRSKKVTEK